MAALTSRFNREWEQEEGRCCLCYDCHRQIYKATVAILQSKVQRNDSTRFLTGQTIQASLNYINTWNIIFFALDELQDLKASAAIFPF